MNKIEKLIFKSFYKNVLPLSIIIIVIVGFLLVVIDYDNISDPDNTTVFIIIGALVVVLIYSIVAVYISKKRKYIKIRKYIEDNSLSYDDEFEKLTKYIYVSKDILIDTYYASKCIVHKKMIESYKKSVVNAGKRIYKSVTFTLKDNLKDEICMCPNEGDYEKIVNYLGNNTGSDKVVSELADHEDKDVRKSLRQPKSAFGTIGVIIVLSLVFGGGYFVLFSSNSAQYNVTDKVLEVVVLNDEHIEVTSTYYEDEEIVYIYNNSPNLLSTDITITNGDKFEDTGKIYIRPNGAYIHVVTDAQDVDEYIINDYTFYRSTNKTNKDYVAYFSENYEDHLDIALYNGDMTEENVRSIINEEKDYVSYADYQKLSYYFYDVDPEYMVNEYPEEGSHSYLAIIDDENKNIELYKNVGGVDTIIETIKY